MSQRRVQIEIFSLRHVAVRANWSERSVNERRLQILSSCRQTKIPKLYNLEGLPDRKTTAGFGERWKPYCSIASW